MQRLGKHKILTLLAGLTTALVIVFSQLFYFQAATYCQNKADTEQQDQKDAGAKSYVSIPSSSISSVFHVEINQDLSFVLETLVISENKFRATAEIAPSAGRLFQTLFRFIIAPNAP